MQLCTNRKYAVIVVGLFLFLTSQVSSEDRNSKYIKSLVLPENDHQKDPEAHLIVVTWKNKIYGDVYKCDIISDEFSVEEILRENSGSKVLMMDRKDFEDLLEDCKEVSSRNKRQLNNREYSRDENRRNDSPSYTRNRQQSGSEISSNGRRSNSRESSLDSDRQNSKEFSPGSRRENSKESSLNSSRQNSKETRAETTTEPEIMEAATTEGYDGWNVIFPGTKWCGAGDIAKNHDDLGFHADTDKCCRAHDLCNDTMAPGQTKNNLTNDSSFTKLSCQCDEDFYNCLDRVDSMISNKIGNIYFNILRRDCYKFDYPQTKKCKKFRSFLKVTCKEYEKNTEDSKTYQWVKPKTYKKLPIPGPLTITLPF